MRPLGKGILAAVGVLSGATAFAADLPTKKPPPEVAPPVVLPTWRFEITGYGWGSSLAGSAGIATFPPLPFYADFE
jgi:hypothetical protein